MSQVTIAEVKRVKTFFSQIMIGLGTALLGASFAISFTTYIYWNLILSGILLIIVGAHVEFVKPRIPRNFELRRMERSANLFFNVDLISVMMIFIFVLPQEFKLIGLVVLLIIFFTFHVLFKR